MRIRLIWQGKTKDAHLLALQADYSARIAHFGELVIDEIGGHIKPCAHGTKGLSAPERRILEKLENLNGSWKILLDERGQEWTSEEFAKWMNKCAVQSARELVFVVGGCEGFSNTFRSRADVLLSLSRMTLTRDWARTLLLEQIYRAYASERGHPYPR
jgi:23S rRNA (pseudouridine1915-N3)-methyltransferase